MKRFIIYIIFSAIVPLCANAQKGLPKGMNRQNSGNEGKKSTFIKPDVRTWRMIDDYTIADTIPVDTLTNGHQINNKIWKENVMNVTLGNLGSPYLPMIYLNRRRTEGNIFFNTIQAYLDQPEDLVYFNTKSPYTNLAYTMGYPKRRSEEFVQVLFTQNVNRRLNLGIHYKFSTSIGHYDSQRTDHVGVRLFGSYDGDYYKMQTSAIYNRSVIKENGGIANDNDILGRDTSRYEKVEDIPVNFLNARNRVATYQILYAHQLDLGHVDRISEKDSSEIEIPVATAAHKIHLMRSHREFRITDLSLYEEKMDELFPNRTSTTIPETERYKYIYNDPNQTADSVKYGHITNIFQLKLNEEFNSLLRFGLRAYIGNDIRSYHWPDATVVTQDPEDDNVYYLHYRRNASHEVSSYVGGQIFKNIGEHFKWNAGAKYYFQSNTRMNDYLLTGNLETSMDILSQPLTIWAHASIEGKSPEAYEDKYVSNHYVWNNNFERQNFLNYSGGIKMKKLKMELTFFGATLKDKIYFDKEGFPQQQDNAVQILGGYIYKHFSIIGFNSINRVVVQRTSDRNVEPLPEFAIYSSNFYENLFFKVLTLQIGFDWRYNTNYYAPRYVPATMQFCAQDERTVGDHSYVDPFVNLQLKKVRIFVKYEHINSINKKHNNFFHTINYPANPGYLKFGLSWNFYD